MASNEQMIATAILPLIGGKSNVADSTNCMTRLRVTLKDASLANVEELKKIPSVLGVILDGALCQIILGPGLVKRVGAEFNALLNADGSVSKKENAFNKISKESEPNPIKRFFKNFGLFFKNIKWKRGFRHLSNVFSPLVPGFIVFGITYSITIIIQLGASGGDPTVPVSNMVGAPAVFYYIFMAIAMGFLSYLAVMIGINSAREFNVTPVIGGIIGGISIFPNLIKISEQLGWVTAFDADGNPLHAFLEAGAGGVLSVILAVFLIGYLERFIRKHMPNVLDPILTPLLTLVIGGSIFMFTIMPAMGFVMTGVTMAVNAVADPNLHWALRALVGFVGGALFLPLVMLGLHRGLDIIHTSFLGKANPIFPVFAMADAAQAGVGIAIYLKARKYKHDRLRMNAAGGVIPQLLGVSEPLVYGVTLPLVKPFLTVGVGAGIAGAFIMAMGVGSSAFVASGFIAIPMMIWVNGVQDPAKGILFYVAGVMIAIIGGFLATWFMISEKDLDKLPRIETSEAK